MRVLIVDDHSESLYLLQTLLAADGYEVLSAGNGVDALTTLAKEEPVDLIVSDILMPQMDGFQLCRRIKEHAAWRRIPFVLYTATYTDEKDRQLGLSLGASHFIVKPIDPDRLLAILRSTLAVRRGEGRAELSSPPDENLFLATYNQRLIDKLEDKMVQLERTKAELETALCQQEAALADLATREAQLRAVVEGTTDAIFIKDNEGRYLLANDAAAAVLGRPGEDLIGKTNRDLFADDEAGILDAEDDAVRASGAPRSCEESVTVGGDRRTLVTVKAPFRDQSGQIAGVIGIARDMTERDRMAAQLALAQKAELAGQLACGFAHDTNNVLTAIFASVAFLKRRTEDEKSRRELDHILLACERAADLTRQLLAFNRRVEAEHAIVDLNLLLAQTSVMIRRLIGEEIELAVHARAEPATVKGDFGMLQQVLLNLATNARDAMPSGGQLRISTTVPDAGPDATLASPRVRIAVSDTGHGIAPEERARIFEPFFTTKPLGKGTGLGLATVQRIVNSHGGEINVVSSAQGTTFRIDLPLTGPEVAAVDQPRREKRAASEPHRQRILVVENDAQVGALIVRMLVDGGYRAVPLTLGPSLDERQCAKLAAEAELAIVDLGFGLGVSGPELMRCMAAANPQLRVLYTSAVSAAPGRELLQLTRSPVLAKPFVPEALLEAVEKALDNVGFQP